jgi:hypothetical protein
MARRRRNSNGRSRIRYIKTKARRIASKGKGLMPAVLGAIAGALTPIGNRYLGKWGQPAALGLTGYMSGNETLVTLAGYGIGVQIGQGLNQTLGGTADATATNGGWY